MTTADGAVLGSTQIFGNAPRNRAFNIALLADGFQASEQALFNQKCMAFIETFRGTPPFNELSPAINVFRINVRSTDSGADDPAAAGGTGATARTYFDASFGALSDATRRGVLEQLGRGDASITALAERFHMTLTGMKKHVGVLEQAGLVSTEKVGRVRTCKLGLRGLEEEAAWIERYRQLWAARFDELDIIVEELKRKEKSNGRKQRK